MGVPMASTKVSDSTPSSVKPRPCLISLMTPPVPLPPSFKDREWTEDAEFPKVVCKLDVILAVVNTINPAAGFTCYYIDDSGEYVTDAHGEFTLPDKPILEMAYNGNHYMSVHYHPALENGSLRTATKVDSHAGAGVFADSGDPVVRADDEKDDCTLRG